MRHTHVFVRAQVRRPLLTEPRAIEFLQRAVHLAGMNVIGGPWAVLGNIPGNEGVSATAILDFSSTNLHEWPEPRNGIYPLIHFDLYTCGKAPKEKDFRKLFKELDPMEIDIVIRDRDEMFDAILID